MTTPARASALAALRALFGEGRSFADTLADTALAALPTRDRGLARALAYGVARERRLLDALIDARLDRPLTGRARRLRPVLQLGVYQVGWLRVRDHAAVNETVGLVRDRRERGLVNAILRRYQRDGAPTVIAEAPPAVCWSHPDWLVDRFRADWDDEADAILAGGHAPGPQWLRIDPRLGSVTDWLAALGAPAETGPLPTAIRLAEPRDVEALPGFGEGWVTVQDAAAQLAAPLLPDLGDGRILDACAAPGGKALQLRALQADARILALDVAPDRVERMRRNFARCGAAIEARVADASRPDDWWDGKPFAAVLVDAPCSGTGVIRRHPDIKWLRRPDDLAALTARQDALLDAAWHVLAPRGALLYTTCSILREENDRRVAAFLERRPAVVRAPKLPVGRALDPGWQILPGEGAMDGFYYALLGKPA